MRANICTSKSVQLDYYNKNRNILRSTGAKFANAGCNYVGSFFISSHITTICFVRLLKRSVESKAHRPCHLSSSPFRQVLGIEHK